MRNGVFEVKFAASHLKSVVLNRASFKRVAHNAAVHCLDEHKNLCVYDYINAMFKQDEQTLMREHFLPTFMALPLLSLTSFIRC